MFLLLLWRVHQVGYCWVRWLLIFVLCIIPGSYSKSFPVYFLGFPSYIISCIQWHLYLLLSNNYTFCFGFMAVCTSVSLLEYYKILLEHYQIVMAIMCKLLFFNRKSSSTVLAFVYHNFSSGQRKSILSFPTYLEVFFFLRDRTHLKRLWCWERLKAGGEGNSWMASLTQWAWFE